MADLVVTAANVLPRSNAIIQSGYLAGEVLAAGKAVYRDATTGKWMLADNNSPTLPARVASGIALSGAALNQPVHVATGGTVAAGATLTPGTAYFLSDTPGGICPFADLATGENSMIVGIAVSATDLMLLFANSGVTM